MGWLGGAAAGRAMLALGLLTALACGDDDDSDKAMPAGDGGPPVVGNGDAGGSTPGLDGATIDGSTVSRDDGSTPAPDAAAVEPDAGSESPDAAVGPCANGCSDGVACTVDRCVEDRCVHAIDDSVCSAGSSCDTAMGCVAGKTCGTNTDCADDNGCTINERCDPSVAICVWDALDRDADGYAPVACGGTDCNDANGLIGPGGSDQCDGEDNDCDGTVDEAASCGDGRSCQAGECACVEGAVTCAGSQGACFDLKTSAQHCGACGESCGTGGVCTDGACACPAPAAVCGATCSDVSASRVHCGGCDLACPLTDAEGDPQSCLAGTCASCGQLDQPCCRDTGCASAGFGATCQGNVGALDSKCVCPSGSIMCDGACVDPKASEFNCGACGNACAALTETCLPQGETAACVACGGIGQPCCNLGLSGSLDLPFCRAGAACGPNDTCVRTMVPGNGNGNGNGATPPVLPIDAGALPPVQ